MAKLVLLIWFSALLTPFKNASLLQPTREAIFTIANFEKVKQFVLQYGNKKTYCNRYNCNPHFDFGSFEVYLNPNETAIHSGYAGFSKEANLYNRLTIVKELTYIDIKAHATDSTLYVSGENVKGVNQQALDCFNVMLDVVNRLDTTLINANKNATGFMICKEP